MKQAEPSIRVRPAGSDDVSSVTSVLRESFAEEEPAYTPEAFAATTLTGERVQARMKEGPVWVALRDDAIVGTVSAVLRGEAVYVRGMAVLPAARGHGVGALLLAEAEGFARARGCTRLLLSTTPFLDAAIRLYERAGFRRSGEGPQDLLGTPLFTMVKELAASDQGR
jgi:GNAT superfamily N-acetyltransferase